MANPSQLSTARTQLTPAELIALRDAETRHVTALATLEEAKSKGKEADAKGELARTWKVWALVAVLFGFLFAPEPKPKPKADDG